MIKKYVAAIAAQMNIQLSKITLVDGQSLGCNDAHLVNVSSDGLLATILVHQPDLDELKRNNVCDRLETRIRSSLSKLQTGNPTYTRFFRRVDVKDGTCLLVKDSLYIGVIKNISLGGLFVTSNIPVKVMDRLTVGIIIQIDTGVINIEADVVVIRIDNWGFALRYDHLNPKDLQALKSFFSSLDELSSSTLEPSFTLSDKP